MGGAVYPQAAFELGRFYMSRWELERSHRIFYQAAEERSALCRGGILRELGYTKIGDSGRALAAIVPLSSDMPLIGIYNNAGAVAVQASARRKKEAERARLLAQGVGLSRSRSRVVDLKIRWSTSTTHMPCFFGKFAEAAEQLGSRDHRRSAETARLTFFSQNRSKNR